MTGGDRRFLEAMVPRQRAGMEMARLALRRAEHGELRELAQRMIDDRLRETEEMQEWHRTFFGTEAPADGAGMTAEMRALARAAPFDRAFIETMVPHLRAGIETARQAAVETDRAEIRELAAGIVDAGEREVGTMERWYRAWYGAGVPDAALRGVPR